MAQDDTHHTHPTHHHPQHHGAHHPQHEIHFHVGAHQADQHDFSNPIIDPHEALNRLIEGNKAWAAGNLTKFLQKLAGEITPEVRTALSKFQKPYAIIITCSDSRVCPELVFNEGLGLLFVIRIAGNVLDSIAIGSIEYAVEHLGSCLIVIQGHQNCGAVKAAFDVTRPSAEAAPPAHEGAPNSISHVVKAVQPTIAQVLSKNTNVLPTLTAADPLYAQLLDECVQGNAIAVKGHLLASSEIIRKRVEEKKLGLVASEYYLDSGLIKVVDETW